LEADLAGKMRGFRSYLSSRRMEVDQKQCPSHEKVEDGLEMCE
jgi:hypothetical protein